MKGDFFLVSRNNRFDENYRNSYNEYVNKHFIEIGGIAYVEQRKNGRDFYGAS